MDRPAYLLRAAQWRQGFESYQSHHNYLGGEWKKGGWWYYYLYAAAVKVPLGLWGLFLLGSLALARRPLGVSWLDALLVAAVPILLVAFVSAQQSMNKHLRYILPAFPFAALVAGAAVSRAPKAGLKLVTVGFLLWAVGSTLSVYPCTLSYFNEAAGGPENGPRHLSGSNVDLGQDLWRLKAWLDAHPDFGPLGMAYHNHIDPRIAGVEFYTPPLGLGQGPVPKDPDEQRRLGPCPGKFAVSVRYVQGSGGRPPDGQGLYAQVPFRGYEYFQEFTQIARAGYSICIYDISLEQANAVRRAYGLAPLEDAPQPPVQPEGGG